MSTIVSEKQNTLNGFPKEFANFLFSLQFINTVDMLPENKSAYKLLVTEPLTLLYRALAQPALTVSESLVTKQSKCVSTMYNDMRFSKSTPLKEYMYIRFREPRADKDILGLYFDMGCDYYSYGIRIYKQTSAGMDRIREKAIASSKEFARELVKMDKIGMAIIGDNYAKDRSPEIDCPDFAGALLKDFLNKKSFYIGRNRPINESVFDERLPGEIASAYADIKKMYTLLKKSLYD